jgi:hypothetical protein
VLDGPLNEQVAYLLKWRARYETTLRHSAQINASEMTIVVCRRQINRLDARIAELVLEASQRTALASIHMLDAEPRRLRRA